MPNRVWNISLAMTLITLHCALSILFYQHGSLQLVSQKGQKQFRLNPIRPATADCWQHAVISRTPIKCMHTAVNYTDYTFVNNEYAIDDVYVHLA